MAHPAAEVRPRIEAAASELPGVRVVVFEPAGTPALPRSVRPGEIPMMTSGRAALVGLMERYLGGPLDPFTSLLEVHKLMYLMQEAGEPLRLLFTKDPCGPYAENLCHMLSEIDGYYTSGYGIGGDAPDKVLELVPGAVDDARGTLAERPKTGQRFERVAKLVEGFESPFGFELLATVHWLVKHERVGRPNGQAAFQDEVTRRFYGWADRKRQFTPEQVRLAARVLRDKGWIGEQPAGPRRGRAGRG